MRNPLTRQTEAQAASGEADNTIGLRTLSTQRPRWHAPVNMSLRRQSGEPETK